MKSALMWWVIVFCGSGAFFFLGRASVYFQLWYRRRDHNA